MKKENEKNVDFEDSVGLARNGGLFCDDDLWYVFAVDVCKKEVKIEMKIGMSSKRRGVFEVKKGTKSKMKWNPGNEMKNEMKNSEVIMFGKIIVGCFVIMTGLILLPVFSMAIKEVVDDWFPKNKITKDKIWKMKVEYDI